MRRILTAALLTTAISSIAIALATTPVCAQMDQTYGVDQGDSAISLDYFSDQLAPFGYWLYSDRWGLVWQPADVPNDFHPYYTAGHWIYTDEYGWYWQSQFPWGDIPFHYGRWVNDPDSGWMWIPGYTWSPGWVTWRSNGQYIGWMPMPPDEAFLSGRGDIGMGIGGFGLSLRFGTGDVGGLYGYSRWYGPEYNELMFAQNWVFLGAGQIAAEDYRSVAITNPVQVVNIIHQTRNVTNYTVVNNYVVNRSVDVRVVERAAGHPIAVVHAASVIRHPNLVATVAAGQRVQMRMRAVAPHGMGVVNSAPPPPPRVLAKLSTRVPPPRAGHAPSHLFTKATAAAPEAQAKFHGATPASGPGAGPGGMTGPGGEEPPHPERPGMNRPNGGPSGADQPGGMNGPGAGEHPHSERPGMNGPNGGAPGAGQPGGMSGPAAEEHPRPERPGMNGPNGGAPGAGQPGSVSGPGAEEHPRPERPGMNGPNGGPPGAGQPNGMTGQGSEEHARPERPGMNGPNGGPPGAEQPGGMTGPGAEQPPRPERPKGGPNGAAPGGMSGPGAEHHPPPPPAQGAAEHPQHPPPKKPPPQNPPQ